MSNQVSIFLVILGVSYGLAQNDITAGNDNINVMYTYLLYMSLNRISLYNFHSKHLKFFLQQVYLIKELVNHSIYIDYIDLNYLILSILLLAIGTQSGPTVFTSHLFSFIKSIIFKFHSTCSVSSLENPSLNNSLKYYFHLFVLC